MNGNGELLPVLDSARQTFQLCPVKSCMAFSWLVSLRYVGLGDNSANMWCTLHCCQSKYASCAVTSRDSGEEISMITTALVLLWNHQSLYPLLYLLNESLGEKFWSWECEESFILKSIVLPLSGYLMIASSRSRSLAKRYLYKEE